MFVLTYQGTCPKPGDQNINFLLLVTFECPYDGLQVVVLMLVYSFTTLIIQFCMTYTLLSHTAHLQQSANCQCQNVYSYIKTIICF